jgi:hypothetical protein
MPVVLDSEVPSGGMTLEELLVEVFARGFDDLNNEEGKPSVTRWINQAYRELCDYAPWPFLEETVSDTAPLVLPNLGHVLSAADESAGVQLSYVERAQVAQWDPDFNDEGAASYWYREGDTLKVFPADEESIFLIRYVVTPEALADVGDTPRVPAAYQDLIVDGAVVRAYKNRDNFEATQAVRAEWERGLRQMVSALLHPNYDNARSLIRTGSTTDYL